MINSKLSVISPQDLHSLQLQEEPVHLIDVRNPDEYQEGHAVGAELLPLDDLTPEGLAQQLQPSGAGRNRPLYLTCASGFRAKQAAGKLALAGYDNLVLLDGGTDAWEKSGLPMSRSTKTISLQRQVQIAVGILILLKVIFGFTVHEWFFAAGALIGVGLITAGITRWCGMARLLALMPWNRQRRCSEQAFS